MSAETLSSKYIAAMEKTLEKLNRAHGAITVNEQCVNEIYGYVRAYLKDAKYFQEQKKFETSLTSIAYCEGLLDALKLIGAVETEK
jgi:FAD synthetase